MGMKLVGLVMAKWAPHVQDRAFRVLMRMAFSALDEDGPQYKSCLYTGGREPLIEVMSEKDTRTPDALDQAIKRSINQLVKVGAIERENRPHPGRRATYRLTLEGPIRIDSGPTSRAVNGGHSVKGMGVTERPEWGSLSDQNGGHSVTPLGELRIIKEQSKEEVVDLSRPVTLARATGNGDPVEKKCDHEDCELGYRYDPEKPKGQRNTPCPECRPTFTLPTPPPEPKPRKPQGPFNFGASVNKS